MTDHSALIERLEERVAYDKRHFTVDPLHAEAAAALRDQRAVMQMAAERLSVHAQVRSKASGETYLRSSMAGIAGDLFAALRPLPSAPNQAKPETYL